MVIKSNCDVPKASCENPQFPNWAWRFNRNQHMTSYVPWQIREERNYPNYRNMGMHRDFRFHPNDPEDGNTMVQLGVTFCPDLVSNREPGFGNGALGRSAGPAPPRLIAYTPPSRTVMEEMYAVNEIHNISPGMSMNGYLPLYSRMGDDQSRPLNPSHYLEKTLGQVVEYPGTFPYFNKPLSPAGTRPARQCNLEVAAGCGSGGNLMERFRQRQRQQLDRQRMDRCCVREQPGYLTSGGDSHRLPALNVGGGRSKCITNRR